MKRICLILMTLLMSITVFATTACGKKKQPENPGKDYDVDLDIDYDAPGKLKIGVSAISQEKEFIDALIAEYNQIFPNVVITVEAIADPYNNSLVQYYQADTVKPGVMPDILLSNSEDMHALIANKILLNLDTYIKASVEKKKLNLDDFYPEMLKLGQQKFNGDQYIMPRSSDRIVTHINQEIFKDCFQTWKKEDLPFTPIKDTYVPQNGWTWDEFLATCAALRSYYDKTGKNNLYLIDAFLSWGPVYNGIFKSFGAELMNNQTGEITIDSEATKKALTLMKDLMDKRYCAPFTSSIQANYEGGQGAMLFHSAYANRWYKALGSEYNLTSFPLIGATPHIGMGVPGYGIYGRSTNKDLAWNFISFMLTKEGQTILGKTGMNTNPIRKDMADPVTNSWGSEFVKKGINMSAYAYGTEYCVPLDFHTYYDSKYQSDLLLAGTTLIIDALSEMTFAEAIATCIDTLEYTIS